MFESLPGFREFYPEDYKTRDYLFQKWRSAVESVGFEAYEGPVLEPLELYTEKMGQEISDQLFHFVDKGARKVALRPEMTRTLGRMIAARANALKRPIKWYNIGDHFRYERMQKGRTRCFTQLNVDIFGEAGVLADAEAISTLVLVCQSLGLTSDHFYVRLSDRDLWVSLMEGWGIPAEKQGEVLSCIDKLEKQGESKTINNLSSIIGESAEPLFEKISKLIGLKSVKAIEQWVDLEFDEQKRQNIQKRLGECSLLLESLDTLGCADFVELDLGIVRGLAYYTGFVFEAFEKGKDSRALAGGGRYNNLIKSLGGPDMPAVGWGMGDVTMTDCLVENDLLHISEDQIRVFAISFENTRKQALRDITKLRARGVSAQFSYKSGGFSKQLKEANQKGCSHALIYGEDELARGEVIIKDLRKEKEVSIPLQDLETYHFE